VTTRPRRFLELLHAGEVAPGEIGDYIDSWCLSDGHVCLHVHLGMTWFEFCIWLVTHQLPTAEEHARAIAGLYEDDEVAEEIVRAAIGATHRGITGRPL
jgi:hypothetical protein